MHIVSTSVRVLLFKTRLMDSKLHSKRCCRPAFGLSTVFCAMLPCGRWSALWRDEPAMLLTGVAAPLVSHTQIRMAGTEP
jgi:hypothetical protein